MYTWPALVIAPQGRACSCTPSTTISSRRVDAHVSHTVTASYRHVRHGSHTCVLAWHALLGDTRCTTGKQTSVRCASARPPFVAASRVPPRTSWAAKLGSLAFKNGLSSEARNWPSFLVQNLDQVLGVLYFYIRSTPWAIFWTKNLVQILDQELRPFLVQREPLFKGPRVPSCPRFASHLRR